MGRVCCKEVNITVRSVLYCTVCVGLSGKESLVCVFVLLYVLYDHVMLLFHSTDFYTRSERWTRVSTLPTRLLCCWFKDRCSLLCDFSVSENSQWPVSH